MKTEQSVPLKDAGSSLDSFWRTFRAPISALSAMAALSLVAAVGCVGGGTRRDESDPARGEAERRLSGQGAVGGLSRGEKIPLWPSVEMDSALEHDAFGIIRRADLEKLRARSDFDSSPASVQQLIAVSLARQIVPFTERGAPIDEEDRLNRAALVSALLNDEGTFEKAQKHYLDLTAAADRGTEANRIDRDKFWADRINLVTLATSGKIEFTNHAKALVLLRKIEAQPDKFFNLGDHETEQAHNAFKSWPEAKQYFAVNLLQTIVIRGDVGDVGVDELIEAQHPLPVPFKNFASAYLRSIVKDGSFEQKLYQERFAANDLLR